MLEQALIAPMLAFGPADTLGPQRGHGGQAKGAQQPGQSISGHKPPPGSNSATRHTNDAPAATLPTPPATAGWVAKCPVTLPHSKPDTADSSSPPTSLPRRSG